MMSVSERRKFKIFGGFMMRDVVRTCNIISECVMASCWMLEVVECGCLNDKIIPSLYKMVGPLLPLRHEPQCTLFLSRPRLLEE